MEYLATGQVAKQAQVNIETVRYYDLRGLMPLRITPKCGGYNHEKYIREDQKTFQQLS